jgi:transposase
VAQLPVSSGKSCRHRLNRCGNRKLNSAVHMIAVTQARMHPPAVAYMERKQADGMSYREALRYLANDCADGVQDDVANREGRGKQGR